MQIGPLRNRITLESRTVDRTTAGFGEPTENWTTLATVWASVEPLSGEEFFQAQQENAEVTHRVRLRFRSGITPKHRLKVGTRILDIVSVIDPEERGLELELLCRERVA